MTTLTRTRPATRSRLAPFAAGTLVVAATGTMLAAGVTAAEAATPSVTSYTGWYQSVNERNTKPLVDYTKNYGIGQGQYAHGFISNKGQVLYCGLDARENPATGGATRTYQNPRKITGAFAGHGDGSFKTAYDTQVFSYVINKWGQGGRDWGTAKPSIAQQAAYIGAVDYIKGLIAHGGTPGSYQKSPGAATVTAATSMLAEAKSVAGTSYSGVAQFTGTPAIGKSGTLTTGVKSSNGSYVPGIPVTVTLTGNATFTDGSKSKTFVSTTTANTTTVNYTGAGSVQANVSYARVPDTGFWLLDDSATDRQSMMIGGVTNNLSASAAVSVPQAPVVKSTPKATTQTSLTTVNGAGVPVTDQVKVTGAKPNSTVTIKDTLYGPLADKPAQSATAPAGTKAVGTVTFTIKVDASGNGVGTSPALKTTGAGYYVWQESIVADQDNEGFTGTFGATTETGVNTDVTMKTRVNATSAVEGASLTDTITVNGTVAQPGSISAQLWYHPLASGEQCVVDSDQTKEWAAWIADGSATKAGTVSVQVTKDGDYTTAPVTADKAGCYTWAEEFTLGGGNTPVATTKPGEVQEVTHVTTTPKSTPKATTQTSLTTVNGAGVPVTDQVKVTGAKPNSTVTIKDTLYGPLADKPAQSATAPAGTKAVGTVTFTIKVDASGNGVGTSPALKTTGAGYYVWQESIVADQDNEGFTGTFGATTETGVNTDVTMKTRVNSASVSPGAKVTDTVDVTGTVSQPGQIKATLWFHPLANGEQCVTTGDQTSTWAKWASAGTTKKVGTVNLEVAKDGRYTTAPITANDAGCYTWSEDFAFTGSPDRVIQATKPGEVQEVVQVTSPKPPSVPTGEGADARGDNTGLLVGGGLGVLGASLLGGQWTRTRTRRRTN